MKEPRITAFIPVWNTPANWLKEAISSVLWQDADPSLWELLIVDDKSDSRDTVDVLRIVESHPQVRVVWRDENGGVGAACQTALEEARGEYLTGIGADDAMTPERLREQVAYLDEGWELVSGQLWYIERGGRIRHLSRLEERERRPWPRRVFDNVAAYRRDRALEIGGFDPAKAPMETKEFWFRWARTRPDAKVLVVHNVWTFYRIHPDGLTAKRRGSRAHIRSLSRGQR